MYGWLDSRQLGPVGIIVQGGGEATMKTRWSYDSDGELDSHRSRL